MQLASNPGLLISYATPKNELRHTPTNKLRHALNSYATPQKGNNTPNMSYAHPTVYKKKKIPVQESVAVRDIRWINY